MSEVEAPATLDAEVIQGEAVPEQSAPESQQSQESATEPQQEQKPELTEEQKRIRALERKLEKAQRANGRLHGELEQVRQSSQRQPEFDPDGREPEANEDPRVIARQIADAERFNDRCNDIVKDGSGRIKGFDESLKSLQEEAPLFDQRGPTQFLKTIIEAADRPADVLHYLGSNPEEAAEIAELSPARIAKRLAQIEAEISAPKKPSSAPQPIRSERPAAIASDPKPGSEGYVAWKLKQLSGG